MDEETQIEHLLGWIYERHGVDYREYARAPLRQRLRAHLRAEGLTGMAELRGRALHDPAGLERLLAALAARDTSMFRRPGFYRVLRHQVAPVLRTYPFINVWHPACWTGEQAYATAIVLREEGLLERSRIYATDVHEMALARAKRGAYPLAALEAEGTRYVDGGGKSALAEYYAVTRNEAVMRPQLRERISFFQHDMASGASFNEFQLIVFRDVALALAPPLHERVFGLLHASLCRLGILALGHGESLRLHPHRSRYEEVDAAERLYRRVT